MENKDSFPWLGLLVVLLFLGVLLVPVLTFILDTWLKIAALGWFSK